MSDVLKYNKYINLIMDIYDINNNTKYTKEKVRMERSLKFPYKKHPVYPARDNLQYMIDEAYDDILHKNILNPPSMSFEDLWEFCQFVKFAEKVFFYPNDSTNAFYVDTSLFDAEKRVFSINDELGNYQILFKLEKQKEKVTDSELKIIRIVVNRNFGRKMSNEFIVVNAEVKFNDESDSYLIANINNILKTRINTVFEDIIKLVKDPITDLNKEAAKISK
jgi:hypothetical protein